MPFFYFNYHFSCQSDNEQESAVIQFVHVILFSSQLFRLISMHSIYFGQTQQNSICTWTRACHNSLYIFMYIHFVVFVLISSFYYRITKTTSTRRIGWLIMYQTPCEVRSKWQLFFVWLIIMIIMKIMTMNSQTVSKSQRKVVIIKKFVTYQNRKKWPTNSNASERENKITTHTKIWY